MHFCIEVKVIIRILHFTRFFEHTAIILNTTVYTYANIKIYIYMISKKQNGSQIWFNKLGMQGKQ